MVTADRCALLILDMVNLFDFDGGRSLARAARSIVPALASLRARFDAAGAPVVYVNDNFTRWQGEFRDLIDRAMAKGGVAREIATRLHPEPQHYYILKPKHSAFLATALPVLLAKLGASRLAITGIAADSCVLATAQDANMREFRIWVPGDCVAAQTLRRKQNALAVLDAGLGAEVRASACVEGLFPD